MRLPRWLWITIAVIAALAAAVIDLNPDAPPPSASTPEQVARAHALVERARAQLWVGNGDAMVTAERAELESAAALVTSLRSVARIGATIDDRQIVIAASRAIGPFWLNARARIDPSIAGFPVVHLTVGRIPLGARLSRLVIAAGLRFAIARGVPLPPLDALVRDLAIDPDRVRVTLHLGSTRAIANGIAGLGSTPIDPDITAKSYCALIAANRTAPTQSFAIVVNRAFTPQPRDVAHNRAAFVALAIYTTGPAAGRLARLEPARIAACGSPALPPMFRGRDDLPKHWSLSAALTAALGDGIGRAMGEWKELSDSLPHGSGFSFVDLTADRSGLYAGRLGSADDTGAAMAARLAVATTDDLLPLAALAQQEGMSETIFAQRYQQIDSARYAAEVRRIDAMLAHGIARP